MFDGLLKKKLCLKDVIDQSLSHTKSTKWWY